MAYRPELSSMDKDTILFIRKNRVGLAFHWDFYKKNLSLISKLFVNDPPVYTLYKAGTNPGLASWVIYNKAIINGQYSNIKPRYLFNDQTKKVTILRDYDQKCCDDAFAKGNYLATTIPNLVIPYTEYIDADGFRYSIGINDGTMTYVLHERLNAGGSDDKPIKIEQGSIVNKTLGFENRHLMEDIKLTFKDSTPENTIVSLNSQILPVVIDNVNRSVGWIRQGLRSTSYMNNDFTKTADYSVKTPVELVNEEVRYGNSDDAQDHMLGLEPISPFRFFYNNVKTHLFGFNLSTNVLKRTSNVNSNVWDELTLPNLTTKVMNSDDSETDVASEVVVFPIHDESKTSNILIAMDVGRFVDTDDYHFIRKYAYSTDDGDTWTTVTYNSAFGVDNVTIVPVFFPSVNALYVISSADDYTSFIKTVDGIRWTAVDDGTTITGKIVATTNQDIRNKVLIGYGNDQIVKMVDIFSGNLSYDAKVKIGVTTIADYIYLTSHFGDISTYNDSVFVYGSDLELYVKDDERDWLPLKDSDGTTLTLTEYISNCENCNGVTIPTFLDIRLTGSYFVNSTKYYTLQSYEKRKTDDADENYHTNINIWSISLDQSGNFMALGQNTYHSNFTSDNKISSVNQTGESKNSLAPFNPICIGGVYVGFVNATSAYNSGDVESGVNTLRTKNLLSTLELDGSDVSINAIEAGECYKYVFENKNVDVERSYGYLMHYALFDGKKHIIFVGDYKSDEVDSELTPVLFDYRLNGDINFHYDMRVKAYRWHGVKCTQQIRARYITDPDSAMDVASCPRAPTKIGFPIKINPNAFLLLYNGIPILDGSAYVNPENPTEIICENLQRYRVMQEYLNPIQYVKNMREFIYNDFTVINFTAENDEKEVYMFCDRGSSSYYGKTCRVHFHSDIAGDLVVFNGLDHEYIINHKSKRDIEYIISRHGLSEAVYTNSPYNHIGLYNIRTDVPRNIVRIQMALIDKPE